MKYIAHTKENESPQPLREHLENVSRLCREYAIEPLKEYAELCGLLHDIGKYTKSFQRYINGKNMRTEHARYGAQELARRKPELYIPMLEYCIAGHHAGLPDGGTCADTPDSSTLNGILKRDEEDISVFKDEISPRYPQDRLREILGKCGSKEEIIELYAFLTRYMYSCLTDADFIDTEQFCAPESARGVYGDFEKAYELLCKKMDEFVPKTELQKARNVIQAQVYKGAETHSDIYLMDMPTGSGKTLCSLRVALEKAIREKKKRIIYIIPYVSIIEQTANTFEGIFGEVLPVLQHHSNYDFDEREAVEDELTADKLKRACENWDAGLIVTTNIQFFESVYHYKGSRLRKLHNLSDSVLVFDEFHMLPPKYIQPCLRAIGYVTKNLGSTAILMSATMPDYSELSELYMRGNSITETVKDKLIFKAFDKCRYSYAGEKNLDAIAEMAAAEDNALIVVNTRKTARLLYDICKTCCGSVYHLSTYMTPEHRSAVIEKVRQKLSAGEKVTVVSTSLIEAGVDLDFKAVFREISGLDSVIQAGGRCNREGKLDLGRVVVFETGALPRSMELKANITRSLFSEFENIAEESCVKEYYRRLMSMDIDEIKRNTITAGMAALQFDSIPFRSYAESFRFIESETVNIIIPSDKNADLLKELEYGRLSAKRRLQKYCACVHFYELEHMLASGIAEQLPGGAYKLINRDYYDDAIGLCIEREIDYIL